MSYLLFLDDRRTPTDVSWVHLPRGNWVLARSFRDFVDRIESLGPPRFVSFDYDLGATQSGCDCAKWLVRYCLDNDEALPVYEVHSTHSAGAAEISQILGAARSAMDFIG